MNTDTHAPSRPTQQSQPRQPDTRPGWLEYFVGKAYLNRAFDFDGQTARKTFWGNCAWMLLFGLTAMAVSALLSRNCWLGGLEWADLVWVAFLVLTLVPTLAIGARRLRDAAWPPLLVAFYAVPLVVLAVLCLLPIDHLGLWLGVLTVLDFLVVFAILYAQRGGTACPPTRCKPLDIIVLVLCLLLLLAGLFKLFHDCRHPLPRHHHDREVVVAKDTVFVVDTVVVADTVADNSMVDEANRVGQSGDLKVTLLWDFYSDIDLHVKQPNGHEIYYMDAEDSQTGGFLDVDDREGGQGSAENVFWQTPPSGRYEVSLVYFSAPAGHSGGNCTVVVQQKGRAPQTFNVPMTHEGQRQNVTTITIP